MTPTQYRLDGKKVGIIGFNARPLASSVKRLGGQTYVSDYWGDLDLAKWSDEYTTVLSPIPGNRPRGVVETPVYMLLVENFLNAFSEVEFDHVLIGSGFDDHADTLGPIAKSFPVTGNSPELMKRARDKKSLQKIAQKFGIETPKTIPVSSVDEIWEAVNGFSYPVVLRPRISGGGAGIRMFSSAVSLSNSLDKRDAFELYVQEYVPGIDISASVLASSSDAITLSIQGQLIGMPSAGRNCDFAYCGNYTPVALPDKARSLISEFSEFMVRSLHLFGSNGIDYVVGDDGVIYLLEVNPRIQGSLELLEAVSDISVSAMHFQACLGKLPESLPAWRSGVKMIVYASHDGTVPDLGQFQDVVDCSPLGIAVNRGDPICTVIKTGKSLHAAYDAAFRTAGDIRRATS
jgi:predicted ATP-grasp superfamily ATP-dependent carboligase